MLLFSKQESPAVVILWARPLPDKQGTWWRQQAALRQPAGGPASTTQLGSWAQPGTHG